MSCGFSAGHFFIAFKSEKCICPHLRLTAETKIAVPDGTPLGFKPPTFLELLICIDRKCLFARL